MIAAGYEVVNTTAEIYKQGSCTVYKSPSGYNEGALTPKNATSTSGSILTQLVSMPPLLQTDAALYPNSRTWDAKEGAYMVMSLNDPAEFILPAIGNMAGLQLGRGEPAGGLFGYAYLPPVWNATGAHPYVPNNNSLPFDISGAIFTGLNPLSTFQVTARYIIERVPTVLTPDLLVLTRVPCAYDPVILEIYSRVIAEMPVGVMVKENPLGEWFQDILQVVGNVAPMIGQALNTFVPGAGLVGQAVGSMANAGRTTVVRANNGPKQPQKPRKPKGPKQPQNPPGSGKRAKKKKAQKPT